MGLGTTNNNSFKVEWALGIMVVWLTLWMVSYQGFQRFASVTIFLTYAVTLSILPILLLIVIGMHRKTNKDLLKQDVQQIFNNEVK